MDADYLRDLADLVSADAARRRRDRLDRRVVLLHPARPRPGAAEGAEGGCRRRVLGRPRRRLLPLAEVQGRAADSCRSTCTGSSGRRTRPGSRASRCSSSSTGSTPTRGSIDPTVADLSAWQAVALSAAGLALGVAHLRPRLPPADRGPARRDRGDRARGGVGVRGGRALRRARVLPPGRRDARDDHGGERLLRDHPGAPGARSARSRRGASRTTSSGLRAKQRSVHNNYLTLPVVFTMLAGHFPLAFGQRPRLARPARDLRGRRGDPALLQPLAHGQARLVDPRRGRRGGGRARGRARAG